MLMKLSDLQPNKGAVRKKKRVGRGSGSGHGKTACRGHKGQKSRSGGNIRGGFEGGQMPLQRRIPKRGFKNIFKKVYSVINLSDLDKFEKDAVVDAASLIKAGIIKKVNYGIKLLGNGELKHPLTIKVDKYSKTAAQKIKDAGGTIQEA
jgi:large subunit ribosomal protein L15